MKICLACGNRFASNDWRCPSCHKYPETVNGFISFSPALAEENRFFGAEYFEPLFKLESQNFWFRSRNRLLAWTLRRYFPFARSFFEIGVGTGFVLSHIRREFPDLILSGSDIFVKALDMAAKRLPGVSLFQMDARLIPFDLEFDIIGAFDLLEHIDEDDLVLVQIFQATKEGGGILLTVPQHLFLWSASDEHVFHKRRYSRNELVRKVERAGFRVIRVTSFLFLLFPFMFFARMRQRRKRRDFDPSAELRIGRLLNASFENVLRFELAMIKNGFSF
ncbi:MAG: methyltransferase domain-containing protein, partial [Candidatus Hodarchaeota archaeon]